MKILVKKVINMKEKNTDYKSLKKDNQHYRFLFAFPQDEVIFDGLKTEEAKKRVDVVPVYRDTRTKIGLFLKKITLSVIINRYIHMPFRDWFHSINQYVYKEDIDYYMIVPTMSLIRWDLYEVERFKREHPNLKLILLILDSLHSGSVHLKYVKTKIFSNVWDLVITYDQYDAKEFGFTWLGYTYYPQCDVLPNIEKGSDALYIGHDKGKRNHTIAALYKKMMEGGVDCDFRIVMSGKRKLKLPQGIILTEHKYKYCEIAAMASHTNCIIEVLMDGQMTQSYRYFEAITYNKKLLTNNPNIRTLPYYDSRYMKYFSSVEDIDTDWVKEKAEINYGYQGEFSQIHLIDFLEKHLGLK